MKQVIKGIIEHKKLKKKVKQNHGILLKPRNIVNSKYITCGNKIKIKYASRIECYDNFHNVKYNPKFIIEDNVIIGDFFTAYITNYLKIGKNSIFAHNVTIVTENHGINPNDILPYADQKLEVGDVIIGENCWLGTGVVVLPGSKLGDNCVVAANAVVNKQFPSNVMVAGVPAKIIKIFDSKMGKWIKYNEESDILNYDEKN